MPLSKRKIKKSKIPNQKWLWTMLNQCTHLGIEEESYSAELAEVELRVSLS